MDAPNTDTSPDKGLQDYLPVPLKEYLPVPATDPGDALLEKQGKPGGLENGVTLSHELAAGNQEDEGLAQKEHDRHVLDLGWNEKKQDIAAPLVGGMENEELWLLVRRFNKVSYCP